MMRKLLAALAMVLAWALPTRADNLIPYTVLRRSNVPPNTTILDTALKGRMSRDEQRARLQTTTTTVKDGRLYVDLLVDPTATKQQAMELAEALSKDYATKYQGLDLWTIDIFDSEDAWKASQPDGDPKYPANDYAIHYLVAVTGGKEKPKVVWMSEGREQWQAEQKRRAEEAAWRREQERLRRESEELRRAEEARQKEAQKQAARQADQQASADRRLAYAQKLLDQGDTVKARDQLYDLIRRYPDSEAAQTAGKLLKKTRP